MLTKIINCWKENILLFKKDTFLLLLYSWYRTTIRTYTILCTFFLPLILFSCGLIALARSLRIQNISTSLLGIIFTVFLSLIAIIMPFVLHLLIILATRPSMEYKTLSVAFNKIKTYFLFIFLYYVFIFTFFNKSISYITLFNNSFFLHYKDFFKILERITIIFSILFYTDTKGSFSDASFSLYRGILMTLANIPIILCSAFLFSIISYLFKSILYLWFWEIIGTVGLPITISYITVLYIKLVHDQCDLYFGRNRL